MARELTKRQDYVLRFIARQIAEGLPPSMREIGTYIGAVSTNAVNDHLVALEKKGYIRRPKQMASRAIMLTEKGASHCGFRGTVPVSISSLRASLLERLLIAVRANRMAPSEGTRAIIDTVLLDLEMLEKEHAA